MKDSLDSGYTGPDSRYSECNISDVFACFIIPPLNIQEKLYGSIPLEASPVCFPSGKKLHLKRKSDLSNEVLQRIFQNNVHMS